MILRFSFASPAMRTKQEKAANNANNRQAVAMLKVLVRETNNLSEMA